MCDGGDSKPFRFTFMDDELIIRLRRIQPRVHDHQGSINVLVLSLTSSRRLLFTKDQQTTELLLDALVAVIR